MHSVFITNADIPKGDALAMELLRGKFKDSFHQVFCGVRKISRSGSLLEDGGRCIQLSSDPSRQDIVQHLRVMVTLLTISYFMFIIDY